MRGFELFSDLECPSEGCADLLAVALREHQRKCERALQLHLAPAPAVRLAQRGYRPFGPPMAFAQQRPLQEQGSGGGGESGTDRDVATIREAPLQSGTHVAEMLGRKPVDLPADRAGTV